MALRVFWSWLPPVAISCCSQNGSFLPVAVVADAGRPELGREVVCDLCFSRLLFLRLAVRS